MAVKTFKCDPRTTVANTMTVTGGGTAVEAITKSAEATAGVPALEPRLTATAAAQVVVCRFKLPTEAKELIEKNSGKCIGGRLRVNAENRAASGKNMKLSLLEPAMGTVTEPELGKEVQGWFPTIGGPVVSQAEAEEKLNTIFKIEEFSARVERLTAKELWVMEIYFQIEIEYTPGGPFFSESFLQTTQPGQKISGFKTAFQTVSTKKLNSQQVDTGFKTAFQTVSTKKLNSQQTFTGFKTVKGTSTQTGAFVQFFTGAKNIAPSFSQAFLQELATVQKVTGFKSAKAPATQTAAWLTVFTGRKSAKASFTQTSQPGQKISGFKTGIAKPTQFIVPVQKIAGFKRGKASITQQVALVQSFFQPAPPPPVALTWLYARIPDALPYAHTVTPSKPYPLKVATPQPYPHTVEVD